MGAKKLKNEKWKQKEINEKAVALGGGRRKHAGEMFRMIRIVTKNTFKVLFNLLFAEPDLMVLIAPERVPKKFEPSRDYRNEISKRFPGMF